MARGIKELTPMEEDPGVTETTLFEAVVEQPDAQGIYARKTTALDIEAFMARKDGAMKTFVRSAVEAEKERAEEAEQTEKDRAEAAEGAEQTRAEAAEQALADAITAADDAKANKAKGLKTLSVAAVGEAPGLVKFANLTPAAPSAPGHITFDSSARFDASVNPLTLVYTDSAMMAVQIYSGGQWLTDEINTEGNITETKNADGSFWDLGCFNSETIDLSDAISMLHDEVDDMGKDSKTYSKGLVAQHDADPQAHPDIRQLASACDARVDTLQAALDDKADLTALNAVQTALDDKADVTALDAIGLRIDDLEIGKADVTALDAKADVTALAAKAEITALEAFQAAVDGQVTALTELIGESGGCTEERVGEIIAEKLALIFHSDTTTFPTTLTPGEYKLTVMSGGWARWAHI